MDWAGPHPPRSLLTVPNVTAHSSTASVPVTVLLYNDPLLCGFNVPKKGLLYGTIEFYMRSKLMGSQRNLLHLSKQKITEINKLKIN